MLVVTKSVQRAGDRQKPLPWCQKYDAGIDRLLRLDQALLRVQLVVERHHLDLLAENPALGIQLIGEEFLKGLQVSFASAGTATRPTGSI